MNLPMSNAVNPTLASALHNVSTTAPAQGGALSNALGGASHMREDFAQHFARLTRQNQSRNMASEPAPQRQQLAAETPHRPDVRFVTAPTHAPRAKADADQTPTHPSETDLKQRPDSPAANQRAEKAEKPGMDAHGVSSPTMKSAGSASASISTETQEASGDDPLDSVDASAAPSGPPSSDNAWSVMVPQGLQTLQISERLQIITAAEPLPDPQSNAQFARSMGFDEQMIQRLFGTSTQPGLGQTAAAHGDWALTAANATGPGSAAVATANAALTGLPVATSAPTLAAWVPGLVAHTTSPDDASATTKTVGDLLGMGAQHIQINELDKSTATVSALMNSQTPNVSTQNMLAMLSAFVPNAELKRLGSKDGEVLETIDLSGAAGDTHGNPFTPMGLRTLTPSAASAPAASPASTDMAQAYQDLSDKLSTELAGRMHQQLNEGQWKMKFGLKPSHLGAVDVELEMRDGKLTALINTDNATTQQLLNHGSPRLREALNGLGWSQASVNIGQGQSSSAQTGQGQRHNQGPSDPAFRNGESANGLAVDDASPRSTPTSNALLDIYA
ncbi:MAG: flagellar hook-length control protein FliK [Betaproteobacteria bacterium]|nr:flagellar hook-length control protein FliK [Betaproteobacteria bacterium]